jgi:transposase
LHPWAFYQLNQLMAYKAQRKGVPKLAIDPRWSSQECAVCGYIDQANRKTQSEFLCRKCGNTDHADDNAALVLRNRGRVYVNTPIVSDTNRVYACPFVAPGTSLRLLAVGS